MNHFDEYDEELRRHDRAMRPLTIATNVIIAGYVGLMAWGAWWMWFA